MQKASLASLKKNLLGGIFEEKKRKKLEEKLEMLLQNALFLRTDEKRKLRWIESIPHLPFDLLESLIPAVIRENFRFKKKKRNLVVELNKKNVNGQK